MRLSVVIPTWQRTELLAQAVESLQHQTRKADEIIVVYRQCDEDTVAYLATIKKYNLILVEVEQAGVIHAENAAFKAVTGDVVCFLDDDAKANSNWLAMIEEFFLLHPEYAGLGGMDIIGGDRSYQINCNVVGKITWYGRVIGNHHQKVLHPQEVQVLKGVNMAIRTSYLSALDEKLGSEHHLGNGSHWELDLCYAVRKAGGRLFFDPSLTVDHFSNHDHFVVWKNLENNAHNLIYVLWKNNGLLFRGIMLNYYFWWGNSQLYGVVRTLYAMLHSPILALKSFYLSWKGAIRGIWHIYY